VVVVASPGDSASTAAGYAAADRIPPPEGDPEGGRVPVGIVVIALLAAAGLVWFAARRAPAWRAARDRRQRESETSEAAFFARFREAARGGDPRLAVRTLMAWLDRRNPGEGAATFSAFAAAAGDPDLDREAGVLDRALYSREAPRDGIWSGAALADRVDRARRRSPEGGGAPRESLAPLNPGNGTGH
jgi:hypothetical protein